jgi:hypothetical protein
VCHASAFKISECVRNFQHDVTAFDSPEDIPVAFRACLPAIKQPITPLQRASALTTHLLLERRELNERNGGCEEGCLKEEKRERKISSISDLLFLYHEDKYYRFDKSLSSQHPHYIFL